MRNVKLASLCLPACLSVRPFFSMEQLGSTWRNLYEILYLITFRKSVKKIQPSLRSVKNNGYL
jgi:hypothetical protein